ncbi:hypothetical protein KKB55_07720 [Myxococcota bacterium]|nr:hypothetical protein [Myxococcota bacterium]MBU1897643.1 hypothetical protein [Myxococcota bacterium]
MSGVHITPEGQQKTHHDSFSLTGDPMIVITQAFGPNGDNLVGLSDVTFDGFPAITILVRVGAREGLVHLSPIHGDARKAGFTDIPLGAHCALLCPVSKAALPKIDIDSAPDSVGYYGLYLTRRLERGSQVILSDVWGHHDSRVIDEFELISHWASQQAEAEGQ